MLIIIKSERLYELACIKYSDLVFKVYKFHHTFNDKKIKKLKKVLTLNAFINISFCSFL